MVIQSIPYLDRSVEPLLSVVIPTCNRLPDLARCLESLANGKQAKMQFRCETSGFMNGERSYEVIVTDDGNDESAKAMIADRFSWAAWTRGPRRGPAANRNHGAQTAHGEWVVFIDDDCLADPNWLVEISKHAILRKADVVEGRTVIPDKRDNPFLHGVENETGNCYWSCNLAVRRTRFIQIGGFDELFLQAGGEDMEFAWRIKQQGLAAVFEPKAVVLHPQRRFSVKSFLKRVPLLKWSLLYYQRTGQAPANGSSAARIASAVVCRHLMFLVRETWHTLSCRVISGWRTRWFNICWGWLVLPVQLPHLLWWEFQFRRSSSALFRHRSDAQ